MSQGGKTCAPPCSGKPKLWVNYDAPFAELPPIFMPPVPELVGAVLGCRFVRDPLAKTCTDPGCQHMRRGYATGLSHSQGTSLQVWPAACMPLFHACMWCPHICSTHTNTNMHACEAAGEMEDIPAFQLPEALPLPIWAPTQLTNVSSGGAI